MYKKNLEGATLQGFILLENLFKPRQLLAVDMITYFVSLAVDMITYFVSSLP
ncbi:hypothetical protein [Streptococcus pneumoniae]|uniref:hypothetical protein n=1 Tax=Streptococcus pneumoniae TaxID=1313 RepID=UPI0015D88AA4|nr:hypothetical protein [Streptococcus pneumoniae]